MGATLFSFCIYILVTASLTEPLKMGYWPKPLPLLTPIGVVVAIFWQDTMEMRYLFADSCDWDSQAEDDPQGHIKAWQEERLLATIPTHLYPNRGMMNLMEESQIYNSYVDERNITKKCQ